MKKKLIIANSLLLIIFFITSVSAQTEKNYALLLDNTASLRGQLESVIEIGKSIVRKINSHNSISLFGFESGKSNFGKTKVKTILDWNQNDKLNDSIDNLYVVDGKTVLYDAILQAAQAVNLKTQSEGNKPLEKILILVTDGEERASSIKPQELIKYLKDNNIKVFIVGLITELSVNDKYVSSTVSSQSRSKTFLTNLAKETGGRAIFPEKGQNAEAIVRDLFAEIIK